MVAFAELIEGTDLVLCKEGAGPDTRETEGLTFRTTSCSTVCAGALDTTTRDSGVEGRAARTGEAQSHGFADWLARNTHNIVVEDHVVVQDHVVIQDHAVVQDIVVQVATTGSVLQVATTGSVLQQPSKAANRGQPSSDSHGPQREPAVHRPRLRPRRLAFPLDPSERSEGKTTCTQPKRPAGVLQPGRLLVSSLPVELLWRVLLSMGTRADFAASVRCCKAFALAGSGSYSEYRCERRHKLLGDGCQSVHPCERGGELLVQPFFRARWEAIDTIARAMHALRARRRRRLDGRAAHYFPVGARIDYFWAADGRSYGGTIKRLVLTATAPRVVVMPTPTKPPLAPQPVPLDPCKAHAHRLPSSRVFAQARAAWVTFDEAVGPGRLRGHRILCRDLAVNAVSVHPAGAADRAYPLEVFGVPVRPQSVRSRSLLRKPWSAL